MNCNRAKISDRATSDLNIKVNRFTSEIAFVPLSPTELGEALFPHPTKAHFDFQSIRNGLALDRIEFC